MNYTNQTYFFNYNSPEIQHIIAPFKAGCFSDKEKAIALYNLIRDGWKYDPYHIHLTKEAFQASTLAKKDTGNCVEKSILLIACLRAVNLPARLHLGKVKNHIAVTRLVEKFGSNELTPHGMVNVLINNQWLKMSPAFNASLCEKLSVPALEFDGENDSYLQAYNSQGKKFMEYTADYGYFDDVPLDFMKSELITHYPHIFGANPNCKEYRL